jgi:hypothetical protein
MMRTRRCDAKRSLPGGWFEALEARQLFSVLPAAELPVVQVTSTDTTVSESGATGRLTFTRTGDLGQTLTLYYRIAGTANTDVSQAQITFAANQAEVAVIVSAVDDSFVEGDETVIVTLLSDDAYQIGDNDQVTLTVTDNDSPAGLPTINIVASQGSISENGGAGSFQVTRTGSTSGALTIGYTLEGAAANGVDHAALSGTVVIANGQSSALINVAAIADQITEGDESIVVQLSFGSNYAVGDAASAQIIITDVPPPPPVVTIEGGGVAVEGGTGAEVVIIRTGPTDEELVVNIIVGGSGSGDVDGLPQEVVIPAGESSVTIVVNPTEDDEAEDDELDLITVEVGPGDGYTTGTGGGVTVIVQDDDPVDPETEEQDPTLDLVLGAGGVKSIAYIDADGSLVTLKLGNGRALVRMQGLNLATVNTPKGVIVQGDNVRVALVDVNQSTLATALKVSANGGDGLALVNRIRAAGDLGVIKGKVVDLGMEVSIQGSARKIDLNSANGQQGAFVLIAGSAANTSVNINQVQDLTLTSGVGLKQFRTNQWTASEQGINLLTAPSVGKMQIRGQMQGHVRLTDATADRSLGALKIAGDFDGGSLHTAAGVGAITARSLKNTNIFVGLDDATLADASATQGGIANPAATLGKLKLVGGNGAAVENAVVAAWNLGSASLGEVQTQNDGNPFGVVAVQFGSVSYQVNGQPVKLSPVADADPLVEQLDDFVVRQLGAIA